MLRSNPQYRRTVRISVRVLPQPQYKNIHNVYKLKKRRNKWVEMTSCNSRRDAPFLSPNIQISNRHQPFAHHHPNVPKRTIGTEKDCSLPRMDANLIAEVTGTAGMRLLDCEQCLDDSHAKGYSMHPELPWCVMLYCGQHPSHPPWWVCTTCSVQRKAMKNPAQIQRHNRTHHQGRVKKKARGQAVEEQIEIPEEATDMSWDTPGQESEPTPISFDDFSRDASSHYFRNEQVGLGAAYLVGYSTFAIKDIASELDKDEVELVVLVASLASSLSRGERAKLSLIFSKLMSTHSKRNSKPQSIVWESCSQAFPSSNHFSPGKTQQEWIVTVPTTPSLMRSRIMEGGHAIMPNLPFPPVSKVGQDHAYVSLKEVIADFLAHGTPYEEIKIPVEGEGIRRTGETPQALQIMDRAKALHGDHPCVVLLLKRWSDDFQSLKSNKGQKTGTGAWICTITINPPEDKKENSIRNTYPIALGPKGACHEEVEKIFLKELRNLSNGSSDMFFDKNSNRMTRVHAELLVSLADQPERRGSAYLQLGNSTFHARFGYSCDIGSCEEHLRACESCFKYLIEAEQHSPYNCPQCNQCTCWEMSPHSALLNVSPPDKYPIDAIPESGFLRPFQITFQTLLSAAEKAHKKLASGVWSSEETKVFLKTNCLSTIAVDGIVEHANNEHTYNYLEENRDRNPDLYEAIETQRIQSPFLYEMWKPPTLWTSGLDFGIQIEACMHLLSGVVKAQTRAIQHWAACQGIRASFLRYSSKLLDPIQELQLPWCKCPSYTGGKLPGWVSENYMGLSRVSKWFYSGVPLLSKDKVFEEPANLAQKKWLKPHNEGWLKARGLEATGSAEELRNRVAAYMVQDGGPPPILTPVGASMEATMTLIRALSGMIYRLMTGCVKQSSLGDLERCIKAYLNLFCEFDEQVYPKSKNKRGKASWLAKYNFPCLLNLLDVIRQFGPFI